MKQNKRMLYLLLAVCLLIGLLPVMAMAETETSENVAQTNDLGDIIEWNVSLGDGLTLNFYVDVEESVAADAELEITLGGEMTAYKVSQAETDENGYYIFSADVAAAQMTDTVTLQLAVGEEKGTAHTFSVRQYADAILADENRSTYHALVREMLNYGAMAQAYFSYNTDALANEGITVEAAAVPTATDTQVAVSGRVDGISFYGTTLVFGAKTAARYYFDVTGSIDSYCFTVDGDTYEAVEKDGWYYVEIPGIDPQELDREVVIAVTDGTNNATIQYSPLQYIVRMYNSNCSVSLKNLLQAMYGYHLAAKAFTNIAEPTLISIWDFEASEDISLSGSRASRNDAYLEGVGGLGVNGSAALRYWLGTEDNISQTGTGYMDNSITQSLTLSFADHGVDSVTVTAEDDIFWFWADAALSTSQRLVLQLNGNDILAPTDAQPDVYIYTIIDDDGKPAIKQVDYRTVTDGEDIDGVDGLDLVNANPKTDKATSAVIRLSADWSGWIGIPLNMVNNVTADTQITKIILQLRQYDPADDPIEDQNAGDSVYLDEFWLTSSGHMPKLSDDALLYTGFASGNRTSVPLLEFGDGALDTDLSAQTYVADNTASTTYSTLYLTDGNGYNRKNALTVTVTEDNKVSDWWCVDLTAIPETVGRAYTADFADLLPGTDTEDMMIWIWLDGTGLTENARLNLGLNDPGGVLAAGSANYTYEKQYYVDPFGQVRSMYLGANSTGAGAVSDNVRGRITIEAGQAGWIGIPVSRFGSSNALEALGEIRFCLSVGIDRENGNAVTNIYAGDAISIGDIWLSGKNADGSWIIPEPAQPDTVAVWLFDDGQVNMDLSEESYIADITADSTYSTLYLTDDKGYEGKNALTVTVNTSGKTSDWWCVDVTSISNALGTACCEKFSDMLENVDTGDMMLWLWVDGTGLTEDARLNLGLKDPGGTLGSGSANYTYEKQYYLDTYGQLQSMYLGTNSTGSGTISDNVRGRITIEAGQAGWVGIPVSSFGSNSSLSALGELRFSICAGIDRDNGAAATSIYANDSVSIGDIWLSGKDENGEWIIPEVVKLDSVPLWIFEDGDVDLDLSGESYVLDNTEETAYSALFLTDGKGYDGKNALTVTMNTDDQISDWWCLDLTDVSDALGTVNTAEFAELMPDTQTDDLMLWIWVDGTGLTEDARVNLGLKTAGSAIGSGGANYTYGRQYYVDYNGVVRSMCLAANSVGSGVVSDDARGRITIDAGTAGWVGIPVSQLSGSTVLSALGELRVSICKGIDRSNDNTATGIFAGDSVSIGDIWLTKKDEDGNWTAPEPARRDAAGSSTYYTAQDYLDAPNLFVPVWNGAWEVPEELLDWEEKFQQFFDPDGRVMSVGHRGDRNTLYPENSIEGFLSTIYAGIDILEVDVIKTKDGIPVVLHGGGDSGDDLLSITNLSLLRESGLAYHLPDSDLATDWTLDELRQLRLMLNGKVTKYVIPTLEDVLLVSKDRVFVTLDKFHRFDWQTDIVPLIEKTGAYETVLIPYSYTNSLGFSVVGEYMEYLEGLGARDVGMMVQADESTIASVTEKIVSNGFPMVLRLGEFTPGDADLAAIYTPYAGTYRMYFETLVNANDNADVWAEMAEYGFNIIMTNRKPYELCQFIAERYFSDSEE